MAEPKVRYTYTSVSHRTAGILGQRHLSISPAPLLTVPPSLVAGPFWDRVRQVKNLRSMRDDPGEETNDARISFLSPMRYLLPYTRAWDRLALSDAHHQRHHRLHGRAVSGIVLSTHQLA